MLRKVGCWDGIPAGVIGGTAAPETCEAVKGEACRPFAPSRVPFGEIDVSCPG